MKNAKAVVVLALVAVLLAGPATLATFIETWSVYRFDPGDFTSHDVLEWETGSQLFPTVLSTARKTGVDTLDACWDVEEEPEESGTTATFYDRRMVAPNTWVTDIYPGTLHFEPYVGWKFSFNPANVTWNFPDYVP